MKRRIASLTISTLLIASQSFASSVVKTCSTTLVSPDGSASVPTQFEIDQTPSGLQTTITQNNGGVSTTTKDTAMIAKYSVRAGLNAGMIYDTSIDQLNDGEKLIVHAMALTSDPVFKGVYSTGFDLTLVRSATVYQIGNATNMGMSAIVEASDQSGAALGSFLGGFLVSPCK